MTPTHTPAATGYRHRPVTKAPNWHGLVVVDVLLNNLTTGLFLVAAVGELVAPTALTGVAAWAYPIALVLLLADLACLVLDLGDPLRFHHMLRVFKPSSPMSLGTWALTLYSLPLTLLAGLTVVSELGWLATDAGPGWWLRKGAVVAGLVPAFASAAYKGVLFSTTSQPGWRDARWLGAYLLNSAAMLGAAELLVIATAAADSRAAAVLRPAVVGLVVVNLLPLGLLYAELAPTLARVRAIRSPRAAGALVLGSALLPVVLLAFATGLLPAVVSLASVVAASYGVRSVLVHLPHTAEHAAASPGTPTL